MRRKSTLRTLVVAQESTASFGFADVLKLVRKIVIITFSCEIAGGLLLSWRYIPVFGWVEGIGKGFFQAVSAFCNAGFDLLGDTGKAGKFSSLVEWNGDPVVILVTGLLIIIGGLGFIVWSDIISLHHKGNKLHFHSKVVLMMTGTLLVVGTVFFLITEYNNSRSIWSMGSLPEWQRPLAALFQSITPRTAGFNSIDQTTLSDSSKFMTTILMFIGAAPGSTGGGIKVSTFAIILATIISDTRGHEDIVLMRHRLPRETFTRAFAIFGLALSLVLISTLLLTFTESQALVADRFSFHRPGLRVNLGLCHGWPDFGRHTRLAAGQLVDPDPGHVSRSRWPGILCPESGHVAGATPRPHSSGREDARRLIADICKKKYPNLQIMWCSNLFICTKCTKQACLSAKMVDTGLLHA